MKSRAKELVKTDPNIVCREEDENALLFNPDNGLIKMLNRVGYEIWKMCRRPVSVSKIRENLKKDYPKTRVEIIEKDVNDFLTYMKNLKLIKPV